MKSLKTLTALTGIFALALAANAFAQTEETTTTETTTTPAFVDADGDGIPDGAAARHRGMFAMKHQGDRQFNALKSQLTTEQSAEVKALVDAMKAEGKTREEIHEAVGTKLESYGLTLPATWSMSPGQARLEAYLNTIEPEYAAEVKSLIETMKAEGKTADEIRTAVNEKLEGWGYTVPTPAGAAHMGMGGSLLTETQRSEISTMVQEMVAAGNTRDEVRAAVDAKFAEWGIEKPTSGAAGMRGPRRR